ncbi:MAG: hypothetical protein APF84_18710 [Gracilibacter sp. BRH_c7a]|nr:MAG: hypothetical protein APF84_18710 [Gracilibacter sp. BRH_c7a]
MNIEHLASVLSVAKHQHFTEAAYEVSTSQSAISKHIKTVENTLGVQLFKRSSHKVELTPAGDTFVKHARRVLAEFEDLKSGMREHKDMENGTLNLGCIAVVGRLGFTTAIADFQRHYPGINIKFKERNTTELIEMLQRSQVDVAILSPPLDREYEKVIDTFPLIEDEIMMVVDELHPFAKRRFISLNEASQESYIMLNSTTVYSIALKACDEAGFSPNITYRSSHIDTVIGLVSERLGISLLPSKQVTNLPHIVTIPLDPPVQHTTSLAIAKHVKLGNIEKSFIDHCLKWSSRQ